MSSIKEQVIAQKRRVQRDGRQVFVSFETV